MEWGHYTSGSVTLPRRAGERAHTRVLTPAHCNMSTCIRACLLFAHEKIITITHTFPTTTTLLRLQEKKIFAAQQRYCKRVRVECKLQLAVDLGRLMELCAHVCVHTATRERHAHSHFITPQGTFPSTGLKWCGAIKRICCFSASEAAEVDGCARAHTHTHSAMHVSPLSSFVVFFYQIFQAWY